MARCVLPICGRDELPTAPGMPPGVGIPCAHVTPDGVPCPSSFGDQYDAEAKQLIVTEDVLWNLPDVPDRPPWAITVKPPPSVKREKPTSGPKRKLTKKIEKPAPEAAEKAPAQPAAENAQEDEVDSWDP